MGHPKKYLEKFSASSVAEVTMSLRSARRLIASAGPVSASPEWILELRTFKQAE